VKLLMTGLNHQRASLEIREQFSLAKEKSKKIITELKNTGIVSGCVIISTCNRTELYVSVDEDKSFLPSLSLCGILGLDFATYQSYLIERNGMSVMEHLCRVASGLDSQITGDDQIITQVREALELSREYNCTDSYIETMFNLSIHAAKEIKTNILHGSLGASSVPGKTVEKLKSLYPLNRKNVLVIGSGRIGRLIAELLIAEKARVTITLRMHNKNKDDLAQITEKAYAISYDERYHAVEKADIVISATTSPHLTLTHNEIITLKRRPSIIVDLAVPRDVEPSIKSIPGVTLLTIDDIAGEERRLTPESVSMIQGIIARHLAKYRQWLEFRENTAQQQFFPLFINLSGRKALIAGGGVIAERRIKVLLDFGVDITVISPEASGYIERAASAGTIRLLKRTYQKGDITDIMPFIVIAATDKRAVNHDIMTEAKNLNIHVSVADCCEECTFYFPAIADNGSIIAGLVSKDGDHAGVKEMAARIRE